MLLTTSVNLVIATNFAEGDWAGKANWARCWSDVCLVLSDSNEALIPEHRCANAIDFIGFALSG